MGRVIRGLGALTVLLVGLVGVPAALLALVGLPGRSALSWPAVERLLTAPDDGTVLVGLVTIVGWIAWLVFAVSVVSELVGILSRQRIRICLPGLAAPQRLAAGLLISVIAIGSAAQLSVPRADAPMTAPATAAPQAAPQEPTAPQSTPFETGTSPPTSMPVVEREGAALTAAEGQAAAGHVHVVASGDDLWSLAETYYGDGQAWRRIAAANPDRLTGGPDRLQVGWRLVIPDVAGRRSSSDEQVVVRRGDTLSSIADRELGSAGRWRELYAANRAQLSDPDELAVGMRLVLPGRPSRSQPDRADDTGDHPRPTTASHAGHPRPERPPAQHPHAEDPPSTEPGTTPANDSATPDPRPAAEQLPADPTSSSTDSSWLDVGVPVAGVGALLAAGLLIGLAGRRRVQLQTRPVGRRILQPSPPSRALEAALGRTQQPLGLRALDRATRAVAAHCRATGTPLPALRFALVAEDEIELRMAAPPPARPGPPPGFHARGSSWVVNQSEADQLTTVPGFGDAPRPWPALVTLGRDDRGREVLADLEALGLLRLLSTDSPGQDLGGVLVAMATELSFSPWADELILTLLGGDDGLPEALGKHNVNRTDDVDGLLDRLEQRATVQRDQGPYAVLGQHRIDPDLADPWAPEIVLVNRRLTDDQHHRLRTVVLGEPRVTMAAVVVGPDPADAPWTMSGTGDGVRLEPAGLELAPQRLEPPQLRAVMDLVVTTGSDETRAAPWWSAAERPPEPPPDNVTYLDRGSADQAESEQGAVMMRAVAMSNDNVSQPTLALLGPVELLGATGVLPPRAARQCLEYCAWLLEHPGTTAQAMTSALAVAEGTRRSNMSRLRSWLGVDLDGQAYLPDAYTGRIALHPSVTSDWQLVQLLTARGVDRAGDDSLRAALGLVRGAPLADAAPGQWHWAEELRTDMISCVRDIGVELTDRALIAGDIDGARWAASRALAAAPGDERLLSARIQTEHLAGNHGETERLSLQLASQARLLGVDLDPETVTLLQRVVEGRVRARLA